MLWVRFILQSLSSSFNLTFGRHWRRVTHTLSGVLRSDAIVTPESVWRKTFWISLSGCNGPVMWLLADPCVLISYQVKQEQVRLVFLSLSKRRSTWRTCLHIRGWRVLHRSDSSSAAATSFSVTVLMLVFTLLLLLSPSNGGVLILWLYFSSSAAPSIRPPGKKTQKEEEEKKKTASCCCNIRSWHVGFSITIIISHTHTHTHTQI